MERVPCYSSTASTTCWSSHWELLWWRGLTRLCGGASKTSWIARSGSAGRLLCVGRCYSFVRHGKARHVHLFPVLTARRAVRWFLTKAVLFSTGLAALMLGSEILVTSMTPWRRYQDPRARILWDGAFDGSRLVLLGDSLFCSFYVDSPAETLWARLEACTGQRVFPGALNGAKPSDVLAAAVHVSREWPMGATVFIDVGPTRFVVTRVEDPPMGNYPDVFLTHTASMSITTRCGGACKARSIAGCSSRFWLYEPAAPSPTWSTETITGNRSATSCGRRIANSPWHDLHSSSAMSCWVRARGRWDGC